jgi:ABC-type dipeptide/oligopeptide/nickel transport system permease subunit
VALAFGLIASVGTAILTMIIAAVGAWYGGWINALIQRITEVNIVLPFLSILIMIALFTHAVFGRFWERRSRSVYLPAPS